MSTDVELLEALAQQLDVAGVGSYYVDEPFPADVQVGIFVITMADAPERAVALSTYPVSDNARLTDCITGVQVRTRGREGDPLDGARLADAVLAALHGLRGVVGDGDVRIVQCRRQSGTPLGPDGLNRFETSTNYYIDHNRALPHIEDD